MNAVRIFAAALGAAVTIFSASGAAAQFVVTVSANETGVGSLTNTAGFNEALPFSQKADPGPGGLSNALTYDMLNPPGLTAGDLQLQESDGTIGDVIRFNPSEVGAGGGTGVLVFYSNDLATGSLADIGLPTARYTNLLTLLEGPIDGGLGVIYTPTSGQPGFVSGAGGPVVYHFVSDRAAVPEPETWALMLLGLGLVGAGLRSRSRQQGLLASEA